MEKRTMHFGFGVDANYVKYAGVLMTNLAVLHPDRPLYFHLACDGIEAADRQKLEALVHKHKNVRVDVYDLCRQLDALKPVSSKVPPRLNRSMLLRILLPSLVPQQIRRLVYLDVDVICINRLDELFRLALQGQAIGAVRDTKSAENAAALGLTGSKYFFSGVLVIDVPVWHSLQLTERVAAYYQQNSEKLLLADQDALNAVIDGSFTELDKRYNFLIEVNNPLMCAYPANAAILHCVNETKAWTQGCLKSIRELYWRYVRQSPWHDLQPSEPATVKAAFLAATTAELEGEYGQARRYYVAVINRFTEYYYDKAPQLLQAAQQECLAAAAAEKQGEAVLAVRCYGLAARLLMEQYLRENPEFVKN